MGRGWSDEARGGRELEWRKGLPLGSQGGLQNNTEQGRNKLSDSLSPKALICQRGMLPASRGSGGDESKPNV